MASHSISYQKRFTPDPPSLRPPQVKGEAAASVLAAASTGNDLDETSSASWRRRRRGQLRDSASTPSPPPLSSQRPSVAEHEGYYV